MSAGFGKIGRRYSVSIPDAWFDGGHLIWNKSSSGVAVNERLALNLSAVYRAVTIISTTIATMPCRVYRKNKDGSNDEVEHPLNDVIGFSPNPEMTSIAFRESRMAHVLLLGNGYAEIMRSDSGRTELAPIESKRVIIDRDENGRLVYIVTNDDGTKTAIPPERMLHIPNLGGNGIEGWSTIRLARESMGVSLATQDFGASFFKNGAKPSGILTTPQRIGPKDREDIQRAWNETHQGEGNWQKVAVMYGGMEFKNLSIPPDDAQFLQTRQFQVLEIARWFGVPPHLLYDLERATFSNIEHQSIEFVVYSLMGHLSRWGQEMTRKLLSESDRQKGLYVGFNPQGLLEGDTQTQTEHIAKMVGSGVYTINEGRRWFKRPPADGGDVHMVPTNMQTLKQIQEPKQEPIQPSQPSSNAARAVVRDAVARMVRIEANSAQKATKNANTFQRSLDDFYDGYRAKLKAAFRPSFELLESLGVKIDADAFAEAWIDDANSELLTASECSAGELPERVRGLVRSWDSVRVDSWTDRIMKGEIPCLTSS